MNPPKLDLLQGTLDLMVLQTLAVMGSLHGYGIARRIEQVSGNEVLLNQGTIYASLVRGERRTTTARPSSTRSPLPAASSWPKTLSTGAASPASCKKFLIWPMRQSRKAPHDMAAQFPQARAGLHAQA